MFSLLIQLFFIPCILGDVSVNILDLSMDSIHEIMSGLSFKSSFNFALSRMWNDEVPNPVDRNTTNPLMYHDARLDNQYALIRLVKFSNSPKRANYLKLLLKNPTVDPAYWNNFAFLEACSRGKVDLVEILLEDPRIDISGRNNQAIRLVTSNNLLNNHPYTRIFNLLFPRLELNQKFLDAVSAGNMALVNSMLQNPRVIPGIGQNEALRRATLAGHTEIFRILANHPRVDISKPDPGGLPRLAVLRNRVEILDIILSKIQFIEGSLIITAAQNGYTEILDRLLQDPRFNPALSSNFAVYLAAKYGQLTAVDRLLQDPRVDASALNNRALCAASKNNNIAVVERLLQDHNVLTKASLTESLHEAMYRDYRDMVRLLRAAKGRRRRIRWERRFKTVANAVKTLNLKN